MRYESKCGGPIPYAGTCLCPSFRCNTQTYLVRSSPFFILVLVCDTVSRITWQGVAHFFNSVHVCICRYQIEMLEQAQEKNVIAYLGTNSGKTRIATKLIEWSHTECEFADGADGGEGRRIAVFLAPTVQLVLQVSATCLCHASWQVAHSSFLVQQSKVIARDTHLRVTALTGDAADTFSRSMWLAKVADNDVWEGT